MNQSILKKIFNKKAPSTIDGIRYEALESRKPTEDIKETFKKLTQQLNHKIDLCKKDLQQHFEKKGKVDLIFKSLFYPCLWKMRGSCMTPFSVEASFVIFLLCLKSFCYFGDRKF